jgi:hypothetical protein
MWAVRVARIEQKEKSTQMFNAEICRKKRRLQDTCIYLLLLPLALQPAVGFGLSNNILPFFPICHQLSPSSNLSSFFLCSTFVTISFLLCGVVSPTPNPQSGGPGYPFLSGSSPLTCLAWEALPIAYATASITLGIM